MRLLQGPGVTLTGDPSWEAPVSATLLPRGVGPSEAGCVPGRSSGEVWQQALDRRLGGSVGQSLKGLLVSSLLHSWADERRFHRQGVSLPDFITHHGSPMGVSWLLVRSRCSHGYGPVQSLVGDLRFHKPHDTARKIK